MQARYYDPVIVRFYSNDPVGFTGAVDTFNRYSYVGNNPYKYVDPDGARRVPVTTFVSPVTNPGIRPPFLPQKASNGTPPVTLPDIEIPSITDIIIKTSMIIITQAKDSEGEGKKAEDSGKNSKHGDLGRSTDKTKTQLEELEAQAESATGNDKKKLKAKIKKIKRTNNNNKKGTEHHRGKQKGK